ncbi:hypothetical protein CRYUN_Cryun38cG0015700 [Craigia yunnanensis]
MHLQLGEISTVVISSSEAAQQVMQIHDVNFANRPYSLAASFVTYNFSDIFFAPYGDHWRQLRKICTLELLSMRRVQSFRLSERKRLHILLGRAAFGAKYKDQDDFTLLVQDEYSEALGGFSLVDVFPSLKLLHVISGATSKFKKLHQKFDKILQNIMEEHRARKETSTSCKKEADDLVHVLINLKLFLLGVRASNTIEWAMSEMLKNPRVFKKAQIEVRQLIGNKGDVNEEVMEDLKYLKDPNHWPEAEKFYPERFLDSSIDFKGANFELIPFGAGRRMCPGISFGIANIELILSQLLYHFDWKFSDGRKLEDIDMTEVFGLAVGRKHDLCLVPIPYRPM